MGAARKYPDELRDRAVRLVLDLVKDQEASVTAACRKVGGELGIKADTLRGWAKQAQVDRGMRPGTSTADAARIRALERENAELRRVNDLAHGERFFRGRARPPVALVVAFIEAFREEFGVGPACRALRQAVEAFERLRAANGGTFSGFFDVFAWREPSEMVFSQLTKGPVRASGGGRQHVADLDLVVGDDHPVDEQLHQLAPLFEGGGGESGSDGLAERLDAVGHRLQFQALFSGGV